MSIAARREPEGVVAVGASAGGIQALCTLVGGLDDDFHLPVLIVLHLAPERPSHLAEILQLRSRRPVEQARDGSPLEVGRVYVGPPGHHLTVDAGRRIRLSDEPEVRFSRPSVDVLFRSVARVFGAGAVGVVLSGGGVDGVDGALAIRRAGGRVVAQDEATAGSFGMPGAVARAGAADAVLPIDAIAAHLSILQRGDAE